MDSFQEDFITGWGMVIETEPDCGKETGSVHVLCETASLIRWSEGCVVVYAASFSVAS